MSKEKKYTVSQVFIDKVIYEISEDIVQKQAFTELNRELTPDEMEDVAYSLHGDDSYMRKFIQAAIRRVLSFNKIREINKDAKTKPSYYLVYLKSPESNSATELFAALTLKDASKFIALNPKIQAEYCRITNVRPGTEKEIPITSTKLVVF